MGTGLADKYWRLGKADHTWRKAKTAHGLTMAMTKPDVPSVSSTPTQLAFVDFPATVQDEDTLTTFTVEARRVTGVVSPGYTENVTIAIYTGAGVLSGTVTKPCVLGVATFDDLSLTPYGDFQLVATSGDLTPAYADITVTPIPASQLAIVGLPESEKEDTAIEFTVEARKPDGQVDPFYTETVVISIISGTGNLVGDVDVACVAGVATFSLQIDTPGDFTLQSGSGDLTADTDTITINPAEELIEVSTIDFQIFGSASYNKSTGVLEALASGNTHGGQCKWRITEGEFYVYFERFNTLYGAFGIREGAQISDIAHIQHGFGTGFNQKQKTIYAYSLADIAESVAGEEDSNIKYDWKLEYVGGQFRWWYNGSIVRTQARTLTYPIYFGAAPKNLGRTFTQPKIYGIVEKFI